MFSDVRVFQIPNPKGKIIGFAQVTVAGLIRLKGIKIIQGDDGPWIGMHSQKDREGKYDDVYYPINKESRELLKEAVLSAWDHVVDQPPAQPQPKPAASPKDFDPDLGF